MNKKELKEQLEENLLQVFEDINLTDGSGDLYSNSVRDRVLDHMCDVVIKTIDEHESEPCNYDCPRCNDEMRIDDYEHGDRYNEDGKMPCPSCQGGE